MSWTLINQSMFRVLLAAFHREATYVVYVESWRKNYGMHTSQYQTVFFIFDLMNLHISGDIRNHLELSVVALAEKKICFFFINAEQNFIYHFLNTREDEKWEWKEKIAIMIGEHQN